MRSSRLRLLALAASLSIAMGPALAEVRARGTAETAHVDVKDASLAEVLAALHDAYGLAYRSDVSLDRRISGTYKGPLARVISRLLDGTNFVLSRSGGSFRVQIVDAAGSRPIAPAAAKPSRVPADKAAVTAQLPDDLFPPPTPPVPSVRRMK